MLNSYSPDELRAYAEIGKLLIFLVGGFWAFYLYWRYDRRKRADEDRPSLTVEVTVTQMPAVSPDHRTIALLAKVSNNSMRTAKVDLSKSSFVLERFLANYYDPTDILKTEGDIAQLKPGAVITPQTEQLTVKIPYEGIGEIHPKDSMTFASFAIVFRAIYRVTGKFHLSEDERRVFEASTGRSAANEDVDVFWAGSTVIDAFTELPKGKTDEPKK